jgi:predicted component of type VI protein secretion system
LATADFLELARRFCENPDKPLSRDLLDQLVRRIENVLQVVFAGLADAVKGRREFQREFEVEATRILDWAPNPIKHAETAAEIASLLLDPRSQKLSEDQAKTFLKEVFQDLTLHQLGLMAGFRECVRGLLKEFDPVVLNKGGKGESTGKGIGLLGGKGVRTDAAAWRRFLEKYRQLTEEEVRVFEQILAPHFAKGYLSIQKTRRRK